jgi:hypothetical protein
MSQEVKAQAVGDDFEITIYGDAELLEFAKQLAAPCNHCSMKAQIALMSSTLLCNEAYAQTSDERYLDPQVRLSGAVTALEGIDEQEAEAEHDSAADRAAGSHLN